MEKCGYVKYVKQVIKSNIPKKTNKKNEITLSDIMEKLNNMKQKN